MKNKINSKFINSSRKIIKNIPELEIVLQRALGNAADCALKEKGLIKDADSKKVNGLQNSDRSNDI